MIDTTKAVQAMKVTHAAIESVDDILADIKRIGQRWNYMKRAEKESLRQEWITLIVKKVLDDLRQEIG